MQTQANLVDQSEGTDTPIKFYSTLNFKTISFICVDLIENHKTNKTYCPASIPWEKLVRIVVKLLSLKNCVSMGESNWHLLRPKPSQNCHRNIFMASTLGWIKLTD